MIEIERERDSKKKWGKGISVEGVRGSEKDRERE